MLMVDVTHDAAGLGYCCMPLTLGCDCLGHIHYFDATLVNSKGQPVQVNDSFTCTWGAQGRGESVWLSGATQGDDGLLHVRLARVEPWGVTAWVTSTILMQQLSTARNSPCRCVGSALVKCNQHRAAMVRN